MATVLSVTPVHRSNQQNLLSKSNNFDQNYIKLDHIVKYHIIFKLNNNPYRTMPSTSVIKICRFWLCENMQISQQRAGHVCSFLGFFLFIFVLFFLQKREMSPCDQELAASHQKI